MRSARSRGGTESGNQGRRSGAERGDVAMRPKRADDGRRMPRTGLRLKAPAWMLPGVVGACLCAGGRAEAQTVRQDFYITDGAVSAEVLSGNTLYIGGSFTHVGPATGGFV